MVFQNLIKLTFLRLLSKTNLILESSKKRNFDASTCVYWIVKATTESTDSSDLILDRFLFPDYSNFRTFPRPFWEIVQLHGVQELHFSLTQGYWKTKKWGFPPRSAPTGAEIYAWFQHDVYK